MPVLNIKLSDELEAEVVAFADKKGMTKSDAARHLLSVGLAAEIGRLHYGTIADAVRDVMASEMNAFKDALDDMNDDIKDGIDTIKRAQLASLLVLTEDDETSPPNDMTKEDIESAADVISDYLLAAAIISEDTDVALLDKILGGI